jgi:RecB family exonuclease
VRARWGESRFTPYDGVFSSRDALGEIRKMLEERGWSFSPTSLESYAGCPFSYFLEIVLGIDSLEEPERVITISPMQRGSLVHGILARLYRLLRDNNLLPFETGMAPRVMAIADETIERHLEIYPETEPVGMPVFWEMEKRIITDSIHVLLEEDSRESGEYVPTYFEKAFGGRSGGAGVTLPSGERTISFHGRIDRIDTGRGDAFRVIDYKTGRLKGNGQDIAGGENLQLPVYLLAASALLGRPVEAGIAVYRRVGAGGGKRELSFDGQLWRESAAELENVTTVLTGGIENGLFFAAPSGEGCSYCRMRPACPSGRIRIFDAKVRGDERCHGYLSIKGDSVEEE